MIKRKTNSRLRSKTRIRKKISGTSEVPRLTIYRSLNQIYAQIIDDSTGITLVAASSLSKELADEIKAAPATLKTDEKLERMLGSKVNTSTADKIGRMPGIDASKIMSDQRSKMPKEQNEKLSIESDRFERGIKKALGK